MYVKKVRPPKECKKCKKMFHPYNNSQNYCKNPCTSKPRLTIKEMNENWALRTEEDHRKQYKSCKENFNFGQTRVI